MSASHRQRPNCCAVAQSRDGPLSDIRHCRRINELFRHFGRAASITGTEYAIDGGRGQGDRRNAGSIVLPQNEGTRTFLIALRKMRTFNNISL